jgi:hypothetical protein
MKTLSSLIPSARDSHASPEAVISAISALQPKKAHVTEVFAEIFPALREAIKRGVARKEILRELSTNGIKLNAASFKRLFDAEVQKSAHEAGKERS